MPAAAGDPADRQDPMPELPVDSDVEVVSTGNRPSVPPHLRPGYLGLVAVGGAVGTVTRYLITNAVAPTLSQPAITMIINIVGSLLLGVLLEALAFRGPDHGGQLRVRLLIGTGVLGGFTTYSTLSLDVASYIWAGRLWQAFGYGLGSTALGVLAAGVGVWLAMITHRGFGSTGGQR
jgi:fluoride exporter